MKAIISALLAVALAPGAMGLSIAPDQVVAYYVGEDFQGNLIKREIRESMLDHSGSCVGTGPIEADCTTGSHSLGFFTSHGIIIPACGSTAGAPPLPSQARGGCYVGDTQSVLTGSNGQRRFNCQLIQVPSSQGGSLLNDIVCAGQGTFPSGTASHTCHSRAYQTNDNTAPGAGVGAGVGSWGCQILHF